VRRAAAPVVLVLVVEASLAVSYARLDVLVHYWLHALAGATAGLAVLVAVALVRRHRAPGAWLSAGAGHLVSAVPDVLFLAAGVLHVRWMDVFAAHITVHFLPAPLVTLTVLFAVAVAAWAAVACGRRRAAAALLALLLAGSAGALRAAGEPPRTLDGLREAPEIALRCPLPRA
jgi:hypothetical protein